MDFFIDYFKNLDIGWIFFGPFVLAIIIWIVVFILWVLRIQKKFPNPLLFLGGGFSVVIWLFIIMLPLGLIAGIVFLILGLFDIIFLR